MSRMIKCILVITTCFVVFIGCMDDAAIWDVDKPEYPVSARGVFVVNEGNFMYGNASLSYYDIDSMQVYNDVFYHTNAMPLGDVAQSMVIRDSLGYVVVNNSGKIVVFNVHTFEYVNKISELVSPRYIHFINDTKAYVSDLYARAITIINPYTFEITGVINVNNPASVYYQHSTEQMVQFERYVFVSCWSFDNHILVIDTETDQWIDIIEVLAQPNSMVIDKHGKIWVLSDGGFPGSPFAHEDPGLTRIDAASREIEKVYRFNLGNRPLGLSINGNGDTLFFINKHIYHHPVSSHNNPLVFIESPYPDDYAGGFSALAVNPYNSDVYVGDAIDYMQHGNVFRYSAKGLPLDTIRVGIIPGAFAFKK